MNDPGNEWLTAALRTSARSGQPQQDCPPPERIWSAVRLELPLDERLAIVDHLARCAECAEAWSLAAQLASQAETRTAAPLPAGGTWVGGRWWPAAAAAVAALAIGLAYLARPPEPAGEVTVRDARVGALEPRIEQDATYPREALWLRWTPGPAGSRYDIVVTTTELEIVADVRGLERTEYQVPPERLAGLAAGTPLLWRVTARTPEGTTVSSRTLKVAVR